METYLGELKKQLQCSLCNDTLIEPKLVDCFHVFCKLCIKRNAEVVQQEVIFKCPKCESKTLLQDLNNVEDLQISPVHARILDVLIGFAENKKICSVSSSHPEATWHCLDCDRSLCEECLRSHSEFIKNHRVVSLSTDMKMKDVEILLKKEQICKTHGDQNVELYCEDCDMLICLLCLKEHQRKHKTKAKQDIIDLERYSLSKNLEQIEKMTNDKNEKKQQKEIASIIKRDGEKAKKQMKELAEKLIKRIKDNEQQLLDKIQQSITKAERNLRIINHTAQAQEYIKYFMENGTAGEMIDIRHDKTSKNFTYHPFDISMRGIEFKPNEDLCKQMEHGLGLIQTLNIDPKVNLIDITPSDLGTTTETQLIQEAFDNSVCNSPSVTIVKPKQILEITGHSKLKDALNSGSKIFTGIAVNKANSKIAVADYREHCVRVYSMEGELLLTYGSKGKGYGQLNGPDGLAFLNETDLVIADDKNHRICTVNTNTGQMVRSFGRKGKANGEFTNPSGVDIGDDEDIIVCDCNNYRVQVFTKNGDYLCQFSIPDCPYSVVTHNGLFYVSTESVVCVIEMKDEQCPTTVTTIGGKDFSDGQLQRPYGLAIDNDNNLLICDHSARLIYKTTLEGRYVGRSSQLANSPYYIAVLNDGRIVCTSFGKGVVFFK